MSTATIVDQVTTQEGTFKSSRVLASDGRWIKDPSLSVAKSGSLSVRGSGTAGTIAMSPGHGLTTGRMDLFWDGGGRYGVTGTVTGDNVAVASGAGDNLPPLTTVIRVTVPQLEDFPVVTADMQMLLVGCPTGQNFPVWAVFLDGSSAVVAAVYVENGSDAFRWDTDNGAPNPFASDVAEVYLSHGATDAAKSPIAVAYVN